MGFWKGLITNVPDGGEVNNGVRYPCGKQLEGCKFAVPGPYGTESTCVYEPGNPVVCGKSKKMLESVRNFRNIER